MAHGFAFTFVNDIIQKKYNILLAQIKKGDFEMIDELHHLTSGMKALYT